MKSYNNYNQTSSLLVVSSYPPKGSKHAANQDALASFAKNRLSGIRKLIGPKKIIILSSYTDKPETYEDNGILVIRCYRRNHPLDYITLFKYLQAFSQVKDVLVEFEFASFGDTFSTGFFPVFLFMAKSIGKKVTVELHQVLDNLSKINGHIGLGSRSFKIKAFSSLMNTFYRLLGNLSHQIIVLEGKLKNRLIALGVKTPVFVLPHGVEKPNKRYTKSEARRILGLTQKEKYVLNFGFLTWYKGSDLIVKALTGQPSFKLILAGGASQNQKDKPHYQKFYNKLQKDIKGNQYILATDFVDEKQIPLYFAASDLVVLPYRAFMSSSGPLSLALTYQKPFMLSKMLRPYLHSEDIKKAVFDQKLSFRNLFSQIKPNQMSRKIGTTLANRSLMNKLTRLSKQVYKTRQFNVLAKTQLGIIKGNKSIDTLPNPDSFLLEWNRG